MHPGPAPKVMAPLTSPHNGGEGEESNDIKAVVNSNCTEVCCTGEVSQSCLKICLVKVYHKDHPDKAIKAYVILDDQSNRSLARSSFFEQFNIKCDSYSYSLRTCSSTVEKSSRRAEDFVVESQSLSHQLLSATIYSTTVSKSQHPMQLYITHILSR